MENINLKKLIWKIFLIFWNVFAIIGVCVTVCFLYLIFDEAGDCLSRQHGVWDSNAKVCRTDCIKWDKERGCVKAENLQDDEQ